MRSCFHEDAIDEHGFFNGPADEFMDKAAKSIRGLFTATRHYIMHENVELSACGATSEAAVLCQLRMAKDGELFDVTAHCRYMDRFECRDGVWKIVHRQLISDGTRVDKVEAGFQRLDQGQPGARGRDDPSHAFFQSSRSLRIGQPGSTGRALGGSPVEPPLRCR